MRGALTWHFRANAVRDFAWATSPSYLWDATCALVDATGGRSDTADIYSFYRPTPDAAAWTHGAQYNRNAIEFLSRYLWPYPYPQMTAVEGVVPSGGMEYPMLTDVQSYRDTVGLAGDLMHEDAHMWFPMQVGSDEARHAWMDEGLTQFNSVQGMRQAYHIELHAPLRRYLELVRTGEDAPLMRAGDLYPSADAYFVSSYLKTTTVLVALRAVLGKDVFLRAYRNYGQRWRGKHPQPADFFNSIEDAAGRDLSWFWRSWFYETWTLDQAVGSVRTVGDSTWITIQDRGLVPMPVLLTVSRADGSVQRLTVPVAAWLAGAREQVVRVVAHPTVTRVEIDPDQQFPDVDRSNQRWQP